MKKIFQFSRKKLQERSDDTANAFILFVAISFFALIPLALFGILSSTSFIISFAISGFFFTLYDNTAKKYMLFFGIFFAIVVPHVLQMEHVINWLSNLRQYLNCVLGSNISSASIGNAITIASLVIVLMGLHRKNRKIQDLNETINQQEQWASRFDQINQMEDLNERVSALSQIIKKEKDKDVLFRAYNNRGIYLANLGKHKEALEDFANAIALNPSNARSYYNRAQLHKKMKQPEEAMRDYSRAIDLNPVFVEAYNNRGNLYKVMGKLENALRDYNKAIESDPNSAIAYYNRAKLLADIGKSEEALRDYNKAIELKPDYAGAYINRATLFMMIGNLEDALRDYNKAIELKPDYAEAYNNRAVLYKKMGRLVEAERDFQKAIELDPNLKRDSE